MTSIMWFRRDLRLRDNPALRAATGNGPVLGLFVLDPVLWAGAGPARRAWLAASLRSLDESTGGRLCIRMGAAASVVPRLASEVGAEQVHVSQRLLALRPGPRHRGGRGVAGQRRRGGDGHAVRRCSGDRDEPVGPALQGVHAVQQGLAQPRLGRSRARAAPASSGRSSTTTGAWRPCSTRPCARRPTACRPRARTPRCAGFRSFLDRDVDDYDEARNDPGADRTSRLSPYLKYGVVHPRQLLAETAGQAEQPARGRSRPSSPGATSTPTCSSTTPGPRGPTSTRCPA